MVSLDEVFRSIHGSISALLPVDNFYIALYDPDKDEISFPYFVDQYDGPPTPQRTGRGLTEYVLRTGAPLLAPPEVFDSLVRQGEVELIGENSVDWVGVPLLVGERTTGVMVVQSYTEKVRFGRRELEILSFVSSQVAMAIERKRSEEALQESEEKYRTLVENASQAIVIVQDGKLKFVNRMASEITGYPEPELLSMPFLEFVHPDDRAMVSERHVRRLKGEGPVHKYEFRLVNKGGDSKWVEINAVLVTWEGQPATLNFLGDITERRQAEEMIHASLQEKEVLLREIHHRVKNNMQVISSLFNLQAGRAGNEEIKGMLKEAQARIRSMSLVHEKLYQSGNLSRINFGGYINSLALHLVQAYGARPGLVRLETEFEDVTLDIASAMPCGLLLNELISNAIKHAFPDNQAGVIRIGLKRRPGDLIEILVADDGIGFPEGLDFRKAESFGLQIVNLLAHQLEATIELDRTNGTAFTVTFRELRYSTRT
jgi:PAS domain S-box-containing protein